MRHSGLLFALVFVSLASVAGPRLAQATTPVETTIADCVAAAAGHGDQRACIGIVSRPCMELPGGVSTSGTVACLMREADQWAMVVSSQVERLRASESASQLDHLNGMLAAHETWRRARCHYQASIYEGGSLARVVAASCMRDTTADLALELIARGDEN